MPQNRAKTHLLIAPNEVRPQLMERMEASAEIRADNITSFDDLASAEKREKIWHEYNCQLLSRVFTSQEFANEYASSRRSVHVTADRYISPSLSDLAQRLTNSVISQITSLQSIIGRLELIGQVALHDHGAAQEDTLYDNRIVLLAERFHSVARQMQRRYADRPTLLINDEFDAQDLFHALLTIFFDDIRKEEWAPSYAGGASRIDFILPAIEAAVELKKSRPSLSTRQLGDELLIDIAKYSKHPKCRTLYCVVYDPDGLIANPRGVENDLTGVHGNLIVRVFIIPKSH
jgi:hypothetical protein